MPTMNGLELLTKVKAINPSVKTVLISAFEVNEEDFEQSNCVDAFLQKPISIPVPEKNLSLVLSNKVLTFIFL